MKPFFHRNPKLLGLGRQFVQINLGAFGFIFGQFISTHIATVSPLAMFSINQPLFLQKTKHRVSVVRDCEHCFMTDSRLLTLWHSYDYHKSY